MMKTLLLKLKLQVTLLRIAFKLKLKKPDIWYKCEIDLAKIKADKISEYLKSGPKSKPNKIYQSDKSMPIR